MKLALLGLCVVLATACGGSSHIGDGGLEGGSPDGTPPGDSGADLPAALDGAPTDGAAPDSARPDAGPPATWTKVAAPTTARLTGVHGTSASNVWAVGNQMLRFNGALWSVVNAPAAEEVWAVSPTDVWAVNTSAVRHWVGGAWDPVTVPGAASNTVWTGLYGSVGHVWACGVTFGMPPGSVLARFNGSSWTTMNVSSGIVEAMSGSGPVDIWAAGQGTAGGPAIWHYDGTSWQPSPVSGNKTLHGVWMVSSTDVWAVGQQQILHWDGSSWTDATPPTLGQGWLVNAWGAGSSIWAVGYADRDTNANTFGHGIVYHHDGSGWSEVTVPGVIDASTPALFDVWAAGPADVWAVGDSGTLLHYSQ